MIVAGVKVDGCDEIIELSSFSLGEVGIAHQLKEPCFPMDGKGEYSDRLSLVACLHKVGGRVIHLGLGYVFF